MSQFRKTALVTGGNKGIGLEICRQLVDRGFQVFLTARDERRGRAAQGLLAASGREVQFLSLDVARESTMLQASEQLQAQIEQLHVLVNNAGVLLDEGKDFLQASGERIQQTLQINAWGAYLATRHFLPLLKQGSRVIMVSSQAGAICDGVNGWAPVYSISKTTLNAITLQLAHALQGRQIAVNAVCPGWVRTDMGGEGANRSVEQGAETPVWLATEAPTALSGKFFRDKQEISW